MSSGHISTNAHAPSSSNNTKNEEKWSPELLGAAATIIIALLAEWQQSIQFFPTGTAVGLAAAITVVIAAILGRCLPKMGAMAQFFITLVATLLIVLVVGFGFYWHETSPGRDARNAAASWTTVKVASARAGTHPCAKAPDQYGYGCGYQKNGITFIHLDSNKSAIQSWIPSSKVTGTYYAEMTARVSAGSTATACILEFAYRNTNSFFELSLRNDGLQFEYWDGKYPARAFEGPVSVATSVT